MCGWCHAFLRLSANKIPSSARWGGGLTPANGSQEAQPGGTGRGRPGCRVPGALAVGAAEVRASGLQVPPRLHRKRVCTRANAWVVPCCTHRTGQQATPLCAHRGWHEARQPAAGGPAAPSHHRAAAAAAYATGAAPTAAARRTKTTRSSGAPSARTRGSRPRSRGSRPRTRWRRWSACCCRSAGWRRSPASRSGGSGGDGAADSSRIGQARCKWLAAGTLSLLAGR